MRPERIAEPEGGPSEQFLLEQAAQHGATLHRLHRPDRRRRPAPQQRGRRRPDRRRSSATPRSTRSATPASTSSYEAGDKHLTVDVDGVRTQRLRLLRPALRRRVLGAGARHRPLRRRRQLARSRGTSTGGRCCGPGRSRTRRTSLGVNRVGAAGRTEQLAHVGGSALLDPSGTPLVEARPAADRAGGRRRRRGRWPHAGPSSRSWPTGAVVLRARPLRTDHGSATLGRSAFRLRAPVYGVGGRTRPKSSVAGLSRSRVNRPCVAGRRCGGIPSERR